MPTMPRGTNDHQCAPATKKGERSNSAVEQVKSELIWSYESLTNHDAVKIKKDLLSQHWHRQSTQHSK